MRLNLLKMEKDINLAEERMKIIEDMFAHQTFAKTCFSIAKELNLTGEEFESMMASNEFKIEIEVKMEINNFKIDVTKIGGDYKQNETEYENETRTYIG